MTATVLPIRRDYRNWRETQNHSERTKVMLEIEAINRELFDVEHEQTTHELLFISAVNAIRERFNGYRGEACRQYGDRSEHHQIVCRLADRQETQELRAAILSYRSACSELACREFEDLANQLLDAAE